MNTGKLLPPPGWRLPSMPWGVASRWLRAVRDWRDERRRAAGAGGTPGSMCSHEGLLELDARTLRDIGAPPALLARAQRRRQSQRDRHDDLRAGGAAGDWQGW